MDLRARIGSRRIAISEIRKLRGNLEHFQTAGEVRGIIKGPTDTLLGCPGEQKLYIRFPEHQSCELFGGRWRFYSRDSNQKNRGDLCPMGIIRLFVPEESLSFRSDRDCAVWISADGNLDCDAGAPWGVGKCSLYLLIL